MRPQCGHIGQFPGLQGGVKLLGNGELKAKVDFSVWRASKSAIEAVEKAGGTVKILAPTDEEAAAHRAKHRQKKAKPEAKK